MAPLLLFPLIMLSIFSISALPHSLINISQQQQQQHLLLQFKVAISNNNISLRDWTSSLPLCNWTGVTCNSSSHSILSLNLSSMNLQGIIFPLLGNLSSLQTLDLSNNALAGTIPPQLGELPRLQVLWLYRNQLKGTFPPTLSACRGLYDMDLSYNQLRGSIPPELSRLTSLKYLELGVNNLTGTIPRALGNMSSLVGLYLSENDLTGTIPPELGLLLQLKELSLYMNQLSGLIPPQLGQLHRLQVLWLNDNQIQGTLPPELGALPQLKELSLYMNQLSGTIPRSLRNLSALTDLELARNNLAGSIPSSLTNLSKLNELALSNNQLSGNILWDIGTKLSNLQYLSLWANQLSGNIPKSIGNCSRLKVFLLSQNWLSGMVPMEIGKLRHLTLLKLSQNQLVSTSRNTLAFLNALTNCSHLKTIAVSENRLAGVLPPSIGQLSSNLFHLNLSENMIGGTITQEIANLTNITYLDLGHNLFRGTIPSEIKRLRMLERLHLNGNKLDGSIPREFPVSLEGCQKLELLDISYHKLGGRIPRGVIASLKNLQFYLNLSSNSLQGFLPQEMSKIVMAQAIDISRNRLTGVIPKTLGGCTALEHLNLSHNAFEGPIPDSLSKLQNLQEMDLSANFLSGSIPMSFGRLKVLNYMNVSFNNLSGQIPDEGLFPNRTVVTLFGGNIGLCGPRTYSLPPCPKLTQEKHSLMKKIVLPVVGTIALILVSFIIGMLWRHKLSRKILHPSNLFFQRLVYQKISYQDLVIATSGFDESNLLGVGNFGSVYKGILRDGKIVAIKALNLDNEESHKSFNTECRVLGRIRHRNLIRVTSAFYYPSLKGLVLQYASNGSLEKHLHPDRDDQVFFKFGLSECLSIALDVAHGMEYLHHDCPMQIVHCDLKPSNVLLDANMTALVTDFGISRLIATPNSTYSLSTTTFALKGSIGYIAPEYGLGGGVSIKGDVYSYGILLLEMVTRKRPSDDMFMGDLNLQNWVRSSFPDRVAEIIDSRLLRDVNANMEENGFLLSFITVGFLCTNESPRERPSMRDVARALENLKRSLTGNAASSNLKSSISDLLRNINPTGLSVSDSQSSTF
ncbi:hypothetical protein SUGI_0305400 [Cryptomeria japonica]|nr:hypothetical protein SUGI_0305400 [Cryptomeria japonica]